MDITLRSLRHAVALARHRHYGRAAAALNLSQPALSRSIAALEAGLGVALFERHRAGIRPTEFGDLLVARGEGLLSGAGELARAIDRLRAVETGELRVGAGLYPAAISVGAALGRLTVGRPAFRVSLMAEQWPVVAAAVRAGALDVAVVETSTIDNDPRVRVETLAPHPAALLCRHGHPLTRVRAPTLQAILEYPLVGPRLPPRAGQFMSAAATGFRMDDAGNYVPPFHVKSVQTALEILVAGDAVAAVPLLLVERELESGSLVVLDHRAPWLATRYGFAWPRAGNLSAAALAFISEVRHLEARQAVRSAALAKTWLRTPRRRQSRAPR